MCNFLIVVEMQLTHVIEIAHIRRLMWYQFYYDMKATTNCNIFFLFYRIFR